MDSLQIVQLSDLHFGRSIDGGGYVWPGAHCHDPRALQALAPALEEAREQVDGDSFLVVSGDVSALGEDPELALYEQVRDVGCAIDPLVTLPGLVGGMSGYLDIPGNHDYWSGQLLNSVLSPTLRARWPATPWSRDITLSRHLVSIHAICTTADAAGIQQQLAVGAIEQGDLNALHADLNRCAGVASSLGLRPLPVVVIHHSTLSGTSFYHGLSSASHQALAALESTYGVCVLLSGHKHSFRQGRRIPGAGTYELRSPTTLQKSRLGSRQSLGFLVHRITDVPSGAMWETWLWNFIGGSYWQEGSPRFTHVF